MKGRYIVVSTGYGKNGKPYSRLCRVVTGVKENGLAYGFIDDKNPIYEDEIMVIGSFVEYETKRK